MIKTSPNYSGTGSGRSYGVDELVKKYCSISPKIKIIEGGANENCIVENEQAQNCEFSQELTAE